MQAQTQSVNLPPAARDIPLTFGQSISAWWAHNSKEGSIAEQRILRRLPGFRVEGEADPTSGTVQRIAHVQLQGNKHRFINTLSSTSVTKADDTKHANVLLHGYGAGLAFFFLNLQTFFDASGNAGKQAYALDWLGMGLSGRPNPAALESGKKATVKERVAKAEDWFVDSLEEWRKIQGIETMTLVGHSLGGYLSIAYALKHSDRVDKLILLSPAGIPLNPDAQSEEPVRIEPVRDAAMKEVTEGQSSIKSTPPPKTQPKPEAGSSRPRLRAAFVWAWEQGWSPFSILRGLGPAGPLLVGKYSSRRFETLGSNDTRDLHSYIYSTSVAKGSAEYCISHLLAPGAFARMPMVERMNQLKMPVTFAYGDHDWMDYKGGRDACARMKASGNNAVKNIIVPKAGHHLYLDNPDFSNRLLKEELK